MVPLPTQAHLGLCEPSQMLKWHAESGGSVASPVYAVSVTESLHSLRQ